MRLTVRTNLGLRILMDCAVNAPRRLQASDIARRCNASGHHVAQVISRLAEAGILGTARGRGGGVGLVRAAGSIGVGSVIRLLEGQVALAECHDPLRNTCPLAGACRLGPALCDALEGFYRDLDRLTLHDLVAGNAALEGVLRRPAGHGDADACP